MLTVTSAADSHDLTLLATVKALLNVDGSSQNEKLSRLITQASAAVAKYCNRVFIRETLAETFRLTCRADDLLLARFPVSSIVSIVENDVTLSGADYELTADSGSLLRLRNDSGWQWPVGKTVVNYTAGYVLGTNLPDDIARATELLVSYYYHNDGSDLMVRSTDIPGVASRTLRDFPDGSVLPPEVEAMLTQFRRPAGG